MSRRPRRRRGRQRDAFPWLWAVLGALVLAAILGGFGWLYVTASANRIALADNLCPLSGPTGQTLVLIDVSDSIAPITRQDLLNRLHDVAAETGKGALFELRVLEPGATNAKTLFSYCNPGDGAELGELTGNPARAKKRWEEGFSAPLEAALATSVAAGEAESSPIMGAIQEISVERLGGHAGKDMASSLYIASDMLEHTDDFSMYRSGADFAAWKASPAAIKYGTDLAGAEVSLWVIKRATSVPSAKAADFWVTWVLDNGGKPAGVSALQGLE